MTLTPLIWLVAATLKDEKDLFHYTFFCSAYLNTNYLQLFVSKPSFFRSLINSTFSSCIVVLVLLLFSSLSGLAMAKYDFKGQKPFMLLMLCTMLITGQGVMAL